MAPRAAALRALAAVHEGRLQHALRILKAGGPSIHWAWALLYKALHAAPAGRTADLALLRAMLVRAGTRVRPDPIDPGRLAAIARADGIGTAGVPQLLWLLNEELHLWAGRISAYLAKVPGWVDGVALIAVLVVLFGRGGRILPTGMAEFVEREGVSAQGASPGEQWRRAHAAWTRGERLQALRLGRLAVAGRLEQSGLLHVGRGQSDRELERTWPMETRLDFRRFRVEYARARWAGETSSAERAWEHLARLWDKIR